MQIINAFPRLLFNDIASQATKKWGKNGLRVEFLCRLFIQHLNYLLKIDSEPLLSHLQITQAH